MMVRRWFAGRPVVAIVLVVALCMPVSITTSAGMPATVQAVAAQPATALSAEEAAVRLLPYLIAGRDALTGYRPGAAWADAPSVRAYAEAGPREDPRQRLQALIEQGYIVRIGQALLPIDRDTTPEAMLQVTLMASETAAEAFADGAIEAPNESERITAADALAMAGVRAAWCRTVPLSRLGLRDLEACELRWRRGPMVVALSTLADPGPEHLATALRAAMAVDAGLATLPPFDLSAATIAAPATEAERLDALFLLEALDMGEDVAPPGYEIAGTAIRHPAEAIVRSILSGSSGFAGADAALERYAGAWKRVVQVITSYVTSAGSTGPVLTFNVVLDADPQSAQADALDLVVGPDTRVMTIPPPVMFGELTVAYHLTRPRSESLWLLWTHGPAMLVVTLDAPTGGADMDVLMEFARRAEAAYQASPLAGSLTGPPTRPSSP